VVFCRHYAVEKEAVKDVSSIQGVDEVDDALRQMISEGSNITETITRQNDNIKISSELMIHAVYDSLVDLSLQLVIKLYPDGITGLINAEDAFTSFPPGMEEYVKQVRDVLRSNGPSNVHESSLDDAVERTTKLFNWVEKAHSDLGQFFGEHHETVSLCLLFKQTSTIAVTCSQFNSLAQRESAQHVLPFKEGRKGRKIHRD
jgi:hypothetical protein